MVALVLIVSALIASALIAVLMPLLRRYALARPNARSSHVAPTPQGGGIAVVAACLAALAGAVAAGLSFPGFLPLAAAVLLLAIVGLIDDLRPLPAWPRLALQSLAVIVAILAGAPGGRILPDVVPLGLERVVLVVGGVWFVNLVNFIDGLDWMCVAAIVPLAGAIALFGLTGRIEPAATVVAVALLGAMLGFAPFNKPVARLFLGDVGSLPVGLLAGWLLYELALAGALAAALLLPLYYLADTTLTLLRRLAKGERVFEAHRSHYYQRATANGFSVPQVIAHIFGCNLLLAALAFASASARSPLLDAACLAAGALAVALLLARFSAPRTASAA